MVVKITIRMERIPMIRSSLRRLLDSGESSFLIPMIKEFCASDLEFIITSTLGKKYLEEGGR
jgi:hypothetical protein